MVWKPRKGRRHSGTRGTTVTTNGTPIARHLKSCLKNVSPDNTQNGESSSSIHPRGNGTGTGGDGSSVTRDQSTKSARSMQSAFSGSSSRSRESTEEHHARSNTSHGSADSGSQQASAPAAATATSASAAASAAVPLTTTEKKVRFGDIRIREHERVVGDNPSCSTGPPIGIGWGHSTTRVIKVDEYEGVRAYKQKCNVLTRAEREEMLLNWGISFHDIIDSIRTNIRVKNQRRQTVTNLGKVERLEEAFESATRKIKRALLLRRRTGEKVKQLQQQANVAAKKFQVVNNTEKRVIRVDELAVVYEPDENDDDEGSVSEYRSNAASENIRRERSTSLSDFDDHISAISGGFSLSNSATTSVREMEKFYRELEIEMFGDLPLPDMVGETLEVPGLEIPEEERVYHDPTSVSGYEEPPSVDPNYIAMSDESKELHDFAPPPMPAHILHHPEMYFNSTPSQIPYEFQSSKGHDYSNFNATRRTQSMLSWALEQQQQQQQQNGAQYPMPIHHLDSDPAAPSYPNSSPAPPGTFLFHDDPIMAIRTGRAIPPQFRVRGPLDPDDIESIEQQRAKMTRAYLSHTVAAMEQRYLHPSLAPSHPPPPPPPQSNPHESQLHAPTHPESMMGPTQRSRRSRDPHSRRSSSRSDGPEIRHIPPSTYHASSYWMGEDDGPKIPFLQYEPVTIIEDGSAGIVKSPPAPPQPLSQASMDNGPHHYVAPSRFPTCL